MGYHGRMSFGEALGFAATILFPLVTLICMLAYPNWWLGIGLSVALVLTVGGFLSL